MQFVGTGPEEEKLKEIVEKKNLGKKVEFPGVVPIDDMPIEVKPVDEFNEFVIVNWLWDITGGTTGVTFHNILVILKA